MPIDAGIVGQSLRPVGYSFEAKDVMLYALGIGLGEDSSELEYVCENELKVFPTFGVVPPFPAIFGIMEMEKVDIDLAMLLHGEHYLEVRKKNLPVQGRLESRPKVAALYDKGKGALLEIAVDTVDDNNETVFHNRFGVFVRGEGGFGGEKGPEPVDFPPDREPDNITAIKTLPQQALLYRLSGDYNPIHANPDFAALGGFKAPILHGLCTMAFAVRGVMRELAGNNPERFKAVKVRFTGHVYPGETIVTKMWQESADKIIFQGETAERGSVCLSNAALWLNP